MPVSQAEDGERVEPNHVYVIPPNADIAILHGLLTLLPRQSEARKLHLPVDFFFRSLAAERGSHAIGVILSGTASDGTEGSEGDQGGGRHHLRAGSEVGEVRRHAAQRDRCRRRGLLPADSRARARARAPEPSSVRRRSRKLRPTEDDEATLNKIFVIVRNAVGVDFSEYKAPTFERRLARRMALRRVENLQDYLALLQGDPEEIRACTRTSSFTSPPSSAIRRSSRA